MDDVTFTHYDTADYLKAEIDIAAYLEAVIMDMIGRTPLCRLNFHFFDSIMNAFRSV